MIDNSLKLLRTIGDKTIFLEGEEQTKFARKFSHCPNITDLAG